MAEAFRRRGYTADYSLDTGPDGGVDIFLKKDGRTALVQCKRWKEWSVGVSVVREMFGILHDRKADEVFIVTTGGFTVDAEAFAKGKPVKLIDGSHLWDMVRKVQSESKAASVPPSNVQADFLLTDSPECPCTDCEIRNDAYFHLHDTIRGIELLYAERHEVDPDVGDTVEGLEFGGDVARAVTTRHAVNLERLGGHGLPP